MVSREMVAEREISSLLRQIRERAYVPFAAAKRRALLCPAFILPLLRYHQQHHQWLVVQVELHADEPDILAGVRIEQTIKDIDGFFGSVLVPMQKPSSGVWTWRWRLSS